MRVFEWARAHARQGLSWLRADGRAHNPSLVARPALRGFLNDQVMNPDERGVRGGSVEDSPPRPTRCCGCGPLAGCYCTKHGTVPCQQSMGGLFMGMGIATTPCHVLCETLRAVLLCTVSCARNCLLSHSASQSLSDQSSASFHILRITMCMICRMCRRPDGLKLIDTHDRCCAMVEGPGGSWREP